MSLKLITGVSTEPLSLAEAKAACRVDADITADDAFISAAISAARSQAEQYLCRALAPQTWERTLDAFPVGGIELGWPTVTAIVSVVYTDTAGTPQNLVSSAYVLDADFAPGWCMEAEGASWPATLDTANAVRVRFTSGWAEGAGVPEDVKSWIKLRVATLFKFREMVAAGVSVAELPRDHGLGLLDRWVVY